MTVKRPTHEQIAARAHELYLQRGRQAGHEIDDWLQAEYELMQLPIQKLATLDPPPPPKGRKRKPSLIAVVRAALAL